MHKRTLILGHMPAPQEGGRPETHMAAGPWCFVGREALFPDWEHRYTFASEPLEHPEALEAAACQSRALAAHSLPLLAAELRPQGRPLPDAYWDMALGAWLITAAMQVVIYWRRASALVEQWGDEPLRVPLLPEECAFHFATEQDFILGGALGHAYVHWLFSRILEPIWPEKWEKVWLPVPPAEELRHAAPQPATWQENLRENLRGAALRLLLALPFPRVKGFSLGQSLKYSWALLRNANQQDRSFPLADFLPPEGDLASVLPLPLDPLPLLRRSMPESLRTARHPAKLVPARRKRVRVASIQAFEDTSYRLSLARWRGRGHKLVCIQHGGNYGNVRSSGAVPMTENCQHAFITWGWTSQSPLRGNFIPLPHGQLARLRGAHRESSGKLLYVGTEITAFTYRMDSRPTPQQYVQYREDKQWFFEALGGDIRRCSLYRPYFDVPGTLEDAPWLLPHFPDVRLCSGPLDPHMLACRLLVLDHHGTTLELAMAADVPMVLFWDRPSWALCPETEALLDELAAAGIWHPTAEAAAMHIYRIWDNVPAWWSSPSVREARRRWSAAYALTVPGSVDPLWMQTLKTL